MILGFNGSDDKKLALDFLRKNSVTFPSILDSSDAATKTANQDYKMTGTPLSYVIDRQGKIVDAWYGYEKGHTRAIKALKKLGVQ